MEKYFSLLRCFKSGAIQCATNLYGLGFIYMTQAKMAPGHYPELDNDSYHGSEGVSKTHLDTIGGASPAHYYDKYLAADREPAKKTDEMILGDAMHKAITEPDLLSEHFVVWEGPNRSTKEGKAAWAEFLPSSIGKTVLTKDGMKAVRGVRDSVYKHPIAKTLLVRGKPEQSYYSIDPETGELIKCRVDYDRLNDCGLMVDLKSTADASPDGFGKSVANYGYHVQGGFYPYVVEHCPGQVQCENFAFLCFEKVRPYAIGIYYIEDMEARLGMIEARRSLNLIAKCRRENRWPDYGYKPQPMRLAPWKRRQIENGADT
jgi:hypothetical protein